MRPMRAPPPVPRVLRRLRPRLRAGAGRTRVPVLPSRTGRRETLQRRERPRAGTGAGARDCEARGLPSRPAARVQAEGLSAAGTGEGAAGTGEGAAGAAAWALPRVRTR